MATYPDGGLVPTGWLDNRIRYEREVRYHKMCNRWLALYEGVLLGMAVLEMTGNALTLFNVALAVSVLATSALVSVAAISLFGLLLCYIGVGLCNAYLWLSGRDKEIEWGQL